MCIAMPDAAYGHLKSDTGLCIRRKASQLDIEMLATNPLLAGDRTWAIRFCIDGTIRIVLGMRDYGRGCYSAYFASQAAARLGVPFRRIRLHYSATLPAVLQTPQEFGLLPEGSQPGPLAIAIGELVGEMCDRIIEKGRTIFAQITGAPTTNIEFNHTTGRFSVSDGGRSAGILEIADVANESKMLSAA